MEKYPEAKIEVVGVDINEQSCLEANENFASLAVQHKHFKHSVLNSDIVDMNHQEQGHFDVVLIVHTLYFLDNPEDVLKKCQELKAPSGGKTLSNITLQPFLPSSLWSSYYVHSNTTAVHPMGNVDSILLTATEERKSL